MTFRFTDLKTRELDSSPPLAIILKLSQHRSPSPGRPWLLLLRKRKVIWGSWLSNYSPQGHPVGVAGTLDEPWAGVRRSGSRPGSACDTRQSTVFLNPGLHLYKWR